MLKEKFTIKKEAEENHLPINTNGLSLQIEQYTGSALKKIRLNILIKPILITFAVIIISFFIDVSYVPFLGDITINIAETLFPNWEPVKEQVIPYRFWWLPLAFYALFLIITYFAFQKLKTEIQISPASATIDRVVNSYYSIIDSISTALPLIGAAILLLSIKLGGRNFPWLLSPI